MKKRSHFRKAFLEVKVPVHEFHGHSFWLNFGVIFGAKNLPKPSQKIIVFLMRFWKHFGYENEANIYKKLIDFFDDFWDSFWYEF